MSIQVCGPNEAMVKTGMGVSQKAIIVGGCTCFWPCCQELNRMELAVMTVAVHSENVVTAEGVEITAKGLTQVRIDPGMADDQADAMIDARNEDIEHKVEEIIRQKTLYNKSRGEDEQVKGVPGVTDVKVVTITYKDCVHLNLVDASGKPVVNPGKKRLAAFVGPPTNRVVERVYAECHRKLAGSGMMPFWILPMPQQTNETTYEHVEPKLLQDNGWEDGKPKRDYYENATPDLRVQAAQSAYGAVTMRHHPSNYDVYGATGYWPGSMGPVQLYITNIEGEEQTFLNAGTQSRVFHPSVEPKSAETILDLKRMLHAEQFVSTSGQSVRQRICNIKPEEMSVIFMGTNEGEYSDPISCCITKCASKPDVPTGVKLVLYKTKIGYALPSRESEYFERVHDSILLAGARCGVGAEGQELAAGYQYPFYVADDAKCMVFEAASEEERETWTKDIDHAILEAQDRRRQRAFVRDARVGTVLEDARTLADLKIPSGASIHIARCAPVEAKFEAGPKFEPAPEPAPAGYGEGSYEKDGLLGDDGYTPPPRRQPSLQEMTSDIQTVEDTELLADCETHEGDEDFIKKVTTSGEARKNLEKAAAQFVDKSREQIQDMVRETLEGHQRAIMAELTVDEIYKDRMMFQRKVRETADIDLAKMGLRVISYTLKDVSDQNGYMNSLGVRRIEEVKKDARMGEALEKSEADQRCALYSAETVKVAQSCKIDIANADREFTMKQQEWKNRVQEAQQEARMALNLEMQVQERKIAELKGAVDQERVNWQTRVDKLEVDRTGLDLRAQMELPADYNTQVTKTIAEAKAAAKVDIAQAQANSATKIASAEAAVISAQGEAAATVMEAKAEAWLKYGENSYVDMVVEQLPKIASSLVMPLSKVDKMVLINGDGETGAAKVTAEVARVMGQVPEVVQSLTGVNLKTMLDDLDERQGGGAARP